MQKNRCIYCMEQLNDGEMTCPKCQKSFWEYQWQEHWLHPYTVLQQRYVIGAVIKESSLSVSYHAYDELLLRRVVVKECPASDETQKQEFLEEAKFLFGKYDQAGILAVTDVFEEQEKAYFVTEYIKGETLRSYLKKQDRGQITVETAVQLLMPVMEALSYWHSVGRAHGAVTAENILVDEQGTGRLAGWGNCQIRTGADWEQAPEQRSHSEQIGPWSDVYGLSAVFYECITGKCIKDAIGGIRQKKIKPLSSYLDIELRVERAVLQGLENFIPNRFFCIETFLEHLGGATSMLAVYSGAIQANWGERWLLITTEKSAQSSRRRRVLLTRKQKKRILTAAISILLLAVISAGSLYFYAKTHPEKVLDYRCQRAYAYARKYPAARLEKGTKEYEEVLALAKEKGTEEIGEYTTSYTVSKSDVEEAQVLSTVRDKFPVDSELVKDLVQDILQIQYTGEKNAEWDGMVTLDHGDQEALQLSAYESVSYSILSSETMAELKIYRDVVDDRVIEVQLTHDFEECKKILVELLPILVPEMYLTEEEAEEILNTAKAEDYFSWHESAKINLAVYWHEHLTTLDEEEKEKDPDYYSIAFRTCVIPDKNRTDENGQSYTYAGNYARGSAEYEEYMAFVKENATEVTQEGDATIYTMDPEAVLDYGLPCNTNLLEVTYEEFMNGLKEFGYEDMELIKTTQMYEVEELPYGILQTRFFEKEQYQIGDEQTLIVIYDGICKNLYGATIKDEENRPEKIAPYAAMLSDILSKDINGEEEREENREIFEENLTTFTENEGYVIGGNTSDCSYMLLRDDETGEVFITFVRYGYLASFLSTDYYPTTFWPQA